MRWFCKIGLHKFLPKETFAISITDEQHNHLHWHEHYAGHECINCHARKLEQKSKNYYHPTSAKQAFDWLYGRQNTHKPKHNPGIKLVK